MMQAAVNCLVNDARRKLVFASMGCRERRSVTPYPRRNTGRPLRTTRTAAPGSSLDLSVEKIESIRLAETCRVEICAAAKASASATSNVVVNVLLKCELRWKDRTDSILHVCPSLFHFPVKCLRYFAALARLH